MLCLSGSDHVKIELPHEGELADFYCSSGYGGKTGSDESTAIISCRGGDCKDIPLTHSFRIVKRLSRGQFFNALSISNFQTVTTFFCFSYYGLISSNLTHVERLPQLLLRSVTLLI